MTTTPFYLSVFERDRACTMNRKKFSSFKSVVRFIQDCEDRDPQCAIYMEAQYYVKDEDMLPGFYRYSGKFGRTYHIEADWRANIAMSEEIFEGNIGSSEVSQIQNQPVES